MEASLSNGRVRLDGSGLALAWSVAASAKTKGQPTGDGYLIRKGHGAIGLAVVDGTGSGAEAAQAAQACLEQLARAGPEGLEQEFETCHRVLAGGRGVAMGLALIDMPTGLLTWAAVGDVDGVLIHGAAAAPLTRECLLQRPGTLGIAYSGIHPQSRALAPGDLLLLTTDGVSRRYRDRVTLGRSVAETAQDTLRRYGRDSDDCLVLAVAVEAAP